MTSEPSPGALHHSTDSDDADERFRAFVENPAFPCLAGKGVVHSGGHQLEVFGTLGSVRSTRRLARALTDFVSQLQSEPTSLRTFVAVFPPTPANDELEFERQLWLQLQRLHDYDAPGAIWAPGTSDDPEEPTFAFSYNGTAFFVIGLHPNSSRLARRFEWPTLVFNPHEQFQQLRVVNKFERLRTVVRDREIALQGSINPNLADFGERSEARQYSGRQTEDDWQCPFHRAK